ncbi:MAG: hypothetical protein KJ771_07150 [Nanoarchaeota archaeon]|nr:hypothetical protein [Nanoarchaeota archaeon]
MMKNKLTIIGLIFLIILIIPFVNAVSKPIAGKLSFTNQIEQLTVRLYVEVDSPLNGKQNCTINPSVKNGPDGSFSTNLANLVFQDFPSVRCDSFWQAGNPIWYQTSSSEGTFTSISQEVNSGTGLQFLPELTVISAAESSPTNGGSSNGESAGNNGGELIPKKETDFLANVFLNLSLKQGEELITIDIFLEHLDSPRDKILFKLVLFSLPNNNIIKTIEDKFSPEKIIEKSYSFNSNEISDGWYKVQAFAYSNDKLIAVSNFEDFFIKKNLLKDELVEKNLEKPTPIPIILPLILFLISLIIIFIIIELFLKKRMKKK